MTEIKDGQPYLLDDDDFAKLMETSYRKAGSPVDDIQARKVWSRMEAVTNSAIAPAGKKPKNRALLWGALLGAAAAMLLLVRVQPDETAIHQLPVKGVEAADYSAIWAHSQSGEEKFSIPLAQAGDFRLRVKSGKPMTFAVYASGEADLTPKRLAGPFTPTEAGQQDISLNLQDLGARNRICIVAADNAEAYEKTVALLDSVWQMLSAPQCVHVEP